LLVLSNKWTGEWKNSLNSTSIAVVKMKTVGSVIWTCRKGVMNRFTHIWPLGVKFRDGCIGYFEGSELKKVPSDEAVTH